MKHSDYIVFVKIFYTIYILTAAMANRAHLQRTNMGDIMVKLMERIESMFPLTNINCNKTC